MVSPIAAHIAAWRSLQAEGNRAWHAGGHYEHGPGLLRVTTYHGNVLVSDRLEPRHDVPRWVWTDDALRERAVRFWRAAKARHDRAEVIGLEAGMRRLGT
jgi:hypothetical protein